MDSLIKLREVSYETIIFLCLILRESSDFRHNMRLKSNWAITFYPDGWNVEEYRGYWEAPNFEDLGFQVEVLDISSFWWEKQLKPKFLSSKAKLLLYFYGNTFTFCKNQKKKHLLPWIKEQITARITAKDIDYNKIMDDKVVAKELNDI